jgi:hypothetical protein
VTYYTLRSTHTVTVVVVRTQHVQATLHCYGASTLIKAFLRPADQRVVRVHHHPATRSKWCCRRRGCVPRRRVRAHRPLSLGNATAGHPPLELARRSARARGQRGRQSVKRRATRHARARERNENGCSSGRMVARSHVSGVALLVFPGFVLCTHTLCYFVGISVYSCAENDRLVVCSLLVAGTARKRNTNETQPSWITVASCVHAAVAAVGCVGCQNWRPILLYACTAKPIRWSSHTHRRNTVQG